MPSRARRDPVRELAALARTPEPGTTNLGEFVATNAVGLAQVLRVSVPKLEATRLVDDEELGPRIRRLLERRHDWRVEQELQRRRQRSLEAAARLGASARWTELGAELDVDLLFGDLLADRTPRWIAFEPLATAAVVVPRHLVAASASTRRTHIDVAAYVDRDGLHVRWRSGRGGYDWRAHPVDPVTATGVLTVALRGPVTALPDRRRGGAWLGDILRDIGFPA